MKDKSVIIFLVTATVLIVGAFSAYKIFVVPLPDPPVGAPVDTEACLQCHVAMKPKEGYFVHVAMENCGSCHTAHEMGERSELVKSRNELCLTCHRSNQFKVVHSDYQYGNCLSCHDAHQSPYRGILVQNERDLCLKCHGRVEVVSNPVQHQPFKESCISCHAPHGSNFGNLLVADQPEMCYTCHAGTKGELLKTNLHKPFAGGSCLDCHKAHSSPVAGEALLARGTPALCYSCHGNVQNQQKLSVKHDPFARGDCMSCHEPHAAPASSLLAYTSRTSFCQSCHTGVRKDSDHSFIHPVSTGTLNCSSCHTAAHGGQTPTLLRATGTPLCNTCHRSIVRDVQNTVHKGTNCSDCHIMPSAPKPTCGGCHEQKVAETYVGPGGILFANHPVDPGGTGQEVTCASCHDFHAKSENLLRFQGRDQLCLRCHTQESLISR